MDWSERAIEECICGDPALIGCDRILGRQVEMGVGFVDLLALRAVDHFGQPPFGPAIMVVELKKGSVDCAAVGQLNRYTRALTDRSIHGHPDARFRGLLAGAEVDDDALVLAQSLGFECRRLYIRLSTEVLALKPLSQHLVPQYQERLRDQALQLRNEARGSS